MSDEVSTVFVGDSITAGGRWDEWFPDERSRNLGVAGDTTDAVLARLDDIIALQPDTVVLLIGTNDLAWRRSAEHIVRNIEMILVSLRRELPDSQLLVQSVMPREAAYAETIKDVNRHLWQFASTVRAQYLDLWPALAGEDGAIDPQFSDDSLHLNENGYEVWASELRGALETLHRVPPTSRPILLPREHLRHRR
ncbi:GDSL-type esterase/lipase family protein [Rathayibacter sp. KR2-224]|uniref:GDSL-type esterase/lipase family protein n=1 Tax=Rathayibacter sp. KR2-224 TaxID=3400913 RepID=UPI003C05A224